MANTSETRTYDALLSTTLENWAKGMEDEITTSNFFYHMLKKSNSWVPVTALGERCKFSLRYANGNADSYSNYDILDTTPMDGITAGFYDWHQLSVPIGISRMEERKNSGEFQMLDLLEEKTEQARSGILEKFNKAFLQGNGINTATAITTKYTSTINASTFFSPLALLVGQTPSANTIGSIAASNAWWQNQKSAATDTNYASFMKDLSKLRNDCTKGVNGPPTMHLCDQAIFEFYEAALRSQNQFIDYKRADIPFENILFHGAPVNWDEFMPNWSGATTVQSTTQGSWVMLHGKHIQVKYDAQTNFITSPFIRPENQDAKTAQILWYGTSGVNNRRKHGVLSDINTTLTS
mgnify:CR=1 FL=1